VNYVSPLLCSVLEAVHGRAPVHGTYGHRYNARSPTVRMMRDYPIAGRDQCWYGVLLLKYARRASKIWGPSVHGCPYVHSSNQLRSELSCICRISYLHLPPSSSYCVLQLLFTMDRYGQYGLIENSNSERCSARSTPYGQPWSPYGRLAVFSELDNKKRR
jgi:hypothetical protein